MRKDGEFGEEHQLLAASRMLGFRYQVYNYNSLDLYAEHQNENATTIIYLEYISRGLHYNALIPIENQEPLIDIKLKTRASKNTNTYDKIVTSLKPNQPIAAEAETQAQENKTNPNIAVGNAPKVSNNQGETINNSQDNQLYPKSRQKNNTYNEAYQFFVYKTRPEKCVEQNSFNNWKKDISKTYALENKASNSYTKSRLLINLKSKKPAHIPYNSEINNLIQHAHNPFQETTIKHNGIRTTIRNLQEMNIYWLNMSKDVQSFLDCCLTCVDEKPQHVIKIPKIILSKGSLNRLIMDLYQLPAKLIEASKTNNKYVFSCIDHFSKYKWAELIENKEPNTIIACLEPIFVEWGYPTILQSDNGTEFKNQLMSKFLETKNIEPRYSSPRHPQTNGAVEKMNHLVSLSLHASYRQYVSSNGTSNWNIKKALSAFLINQNSRFHTITRKVPRKLIMLTNADDIQEVNDAVKAYYYMKGNEKMKDNINFTLGMKLLVVKDLKKVKDRNKLVNTGGHKFRSKHEAKVNIPCTVTNLQHLNMNMIRVKINGRPRNGMVLNEEYLVNAENLAKPSSEQSWQLLTESLA